jgi:nitrogen regulatory protein P-II 2
MAFCCVAQELARILNLESGWPRERPVRRIEEKAGVRMKMIVSVIKPFKLEEVREALTAIGVTGLTVSDVRCFGRQKGQSEIYRGAEYTASFLPKVKIEVAVEDELVERAVEAIRVAANSDRIGDGKIFVLALEHAVRIRTGETNAAAL